MNRQVDPKELKSLYDRKAKESFKARFDLLMFKHVIAGNKDPITTDELDAFKIEENTDTLKKYINIYWQREDYKHDQIDGRIIDEIYHDIKKWREEHQENIVGLMGHYVKYTFRNIFPFEDFREFVESKKECEYCQITEEKVKGLIEKQELNKKKDTRGWSLEIDRKYPNYEYTKENCVWCCYWCNNAKTDEFSYDEFKKIGAVIKTIWNVRLNS